MDAITNQLNYEKDYEKAFFYAPNGMALVGIDGHFLTINASFCKIFGYSLEELMCMTLMDLSHPDDVHQDIEHFYRLINAMEFTYETIKKYLHKNGKVFWALLNITLIRDGQNKPSYFIAQVQDITDYKLLWDDLKKNEERFSLIEESALYMISEHTLEGVYTYASNSSFPLLGYEPKELIGRNAYELYHPNDIEKFKKVHMLSLNSTYPQTATFQIRTKYGNYVWFETSTRAIFDEHSKLKGFLCFSRDITDRKQTEKLIIQSEKLSVAGQLAAGIAHEIRNPLTSLKGFLQLLQTGDNKQYYFDIMKSELDRIELILSELLVISKPQSVTYHKKDLIKLLVDVCTLLETQAIMQNVVISTNFEHKELYINCDENQIKQVFLNFIKNAIESMNKGGQVILDLYIQNQMVQIKITDQGSGIPKEMLEKLGQPFYSTKEKGTGLGLMVSYKIIEDHHGKVSVESVVGSGTTFTIELPT